MSETWNKKERQKMKVKQRQDKMQKMRERKENTKKGKGLDSMLAYVDDFGNLSDTPPDRRKKVEIRAEDIEIGVPKYLPPTEAELIRKGKITFFNHDKGFGFIKDQVSQQSVFVHVNNLSGALVKENDKVSFEIEMGPRGASAVNVKILH
jgi:cold shock CspA family protein